MRQRQRLLWRKGEGGGETRGDKASERWCKRRVLDKERRWRGNGRTEDVVDTERDKMTGAVEQAMGRSPFFLIFNFFPQSSIQGR